MNIASVLVNSRVVVVVGTKNTVRGEVATKHSLADATPMTSAVVTTAAGISAGRARIFEDALLQSEQSGEATGTS